MKSAMLRAVFVVAVLPRGMTGVPRSKPPSPPPAVSVPAPLPSGKMMGHVVPVAVPIDLDIALVGVVGATPGVKAGSAVFTTLPS